MEELFVFVKDLGTGQKPLQHNNVVMVRTKEEAQRTVTANKGVPEDYSLYRLVPVSLIEQTVVTTTVQRLIP